MSWVIRKRRINKKKNRLWFQRLFDYLMGGFKYQLVGMFWVQNFFCSFYFFFFFSFSFVFFWLWTSCSFEGQTLCSFVENLVYNIATIWANIIVLTNLAFWKRNRRKNRFVTSHLLSKVWWIMFKAYTSNYRTYNLSVFIFLFFFLFFRSWMIK